MCWLSWNLGTSTSWNSQGLSRSVMGLLYLLYIKSLLSIISRHFPKCAGRIHTNLHIFLHIAATGLMLLRFIRDITSYFNIPFEQLSRRGISWSCTNCPSAVACRLRLWHAPCLSVVRIRDLRNLVDNQRHEVYTKLSEKDIKSVSKFEVLYVP